MSYIVHSRPFAELISPEKAKRLHDEVNPKQKLPIQYWTKRAHINRLCEICHAEPVWRFGGTDMCFTCVTGEADPSDDYELEYLP